MDNHHAWETVSHYQRVLTIDYHNYHLINVYIYGKSQFLVAKSTINYEIYLLC